MGSQNNTLGSKKYDLPVPLLCVKQTDLGNLLRRVAREK